MAARPLALLFLAIVAAGSWSGPAEVAVAQDTSPDESTEDLQRAVEELRKESEELEHQCHEWDKSLRLMTGRRGSWAITPDGSRLAAGTPTGAIEVWRRGEVKPAKVLAGHPDLVVALAFAIGEGATLYSVGYEGTLKVWNLETGELKDTFGDEKAGSGSPGTERLEASRSKYVSVETSPDGRYLVATQDRLRVWDLHYKKWQDHVAPGRARSVEFLDDSRQLLVASLGGVELHDLGAPPTKRGAADRLEPADPVWRLRSDADVRLQSGERLGKPTKSEFGDTISTTATVLDPTAVVVTLSQYFDRSTTTKLEMNFVLRAWDVKSGARLWEKALAGERHSLHGTRASELIAVETDTGIDFHSPKDGTRVRSVPFPAGGPRPEILAPDAAVGYAADKDGNLIEIALAPRPAAPAPGPGTTPTPR